MAHSKIAKLVTHSNGQLRESLPMSMGNAERLALDFVAYDLAVKVDIFEIAEPASILIGTVYRDEESRIIVKYATLDGKI